MVICVKPYFLQSSTWCNNNGFPATGIMGLGILSVRCFNLVPFPPANITACTILFFHKESNLRFKERKI